MTTRTTEALPFGPATCRWFEQNFPAATPVQQRGWPLIAADRNTLLLAPTGSGKTLAAFLAGIDRLIRHPVDTPGVRLLYLSPLKALVYDVERNLQAPLIGIARSAEALQIPTRLPRVDIRTGDTPQRLRTAQRKEPAEILVTTPESLYLLLSSQARETLRTVETVIVDEIHAVAGTKRGVHLAVSLERLSELCRRDPQRVGLSATVRPVDEVARFLGGARAVEVVDTTELPHLDLQVRVPVADMEAPPEGGSILQELKKSEANEPTGFMQSLYPRLLEEIQSHRSTILFVNNRGMCERLATRLNELAGEELVRSHHGSISQGQRREMEEALKAGQLKAIVATSSLELGIDMGAVDLVLQISSPQSVARGLQRVGRAGHQVGAISTGRLYPKHRGDLLECAVVGSEMLQGHIEPLKVPRNALDVLSQQIVSIIATQERHVDELEGFLRRAYPYRELTREALHAVLDMLSGRYPSTDFAELRPRLNWDRETGQLSARRGAGSLAMVNGGTIPDRGMYGVHLGPEGPRVGEMDEEMAYEVRRGQNFVLGSTTWRIEEITRDRVVVSPAPGEPGRLPFWRGDGPGRTVELGRALGAFCRELARQDHPERWVLENSPLDELAARNLVAFVQEQLEVTGTLPTDRAITVERFRDELGDWRICILSPFGARVHAPWALAIEGVLSQEAGFDVQTVWSDDGIVLRLVEGEVELSKLFPDPDEAEDLAVDQLSHTGIFASQFRENAGRALLLPRRYPGQRTPLWTQRLKAQALLATASAYPSFPIILETYRSCLQDYFDLPALIELLRALQRREIRVDEVETTAPSPMARSLAFAYQAAYLYEGDTPLAERRAQALTLDRKMLRELLGREDLRSLLDPQVLQELEEELLDKPLRHTDDLHDLLRQVGDRTASETRAPREWLVQLEQARRIARLRLGGEERFVAVEDAALYRDGLGAALPGGLPRVFLEPAERPLETLFLRYARTHGPFTTRELAERYALVPGQVEPVLQALADRGRLLSGDFRPGGHALEWLDPDVLRRLKRRTLARLRKQIAPVEPAVLGRFLPSWQGVGSPQRGHNRLREVLAQLEGVALPFSDLERWILPARVKDFQPRMLDEQGASGQLIWVGAGSLGPTDGRVAIYRRDRFSQLAEPPPPYEGENELAGQILEHLEEKGSSFFFQLPSGNAQDLLQALAELSWKGLITNDTFQPLRLFGRARRRPGRNDPLLTGGRWSLVSAFFEQPPDKTRQAVARAHALLERYGVVSRETATAERLGSLYGVLNEMEESGQVRRGYFVDGLSGAQFAYSGAVDRLRGCREGEAGVMLLASTDPANPYGSLIPWPECAGRPRRAAGTFVVLRGGEPALYVEKNARRVLTFPAFDEKTPAALDELALRARGKILRIEQIDGESAPASKAAPAFRQAGFKGEFSALVRML